MSVASHAQSRPNVGTLLHMTISTYTHTQFLTPAYQHRQLCILAFTGSLIQTRPGKKVIVRKLASKEGPGCNQISPANPQRDGRGPTHLTFSHPEQNTSSSGKVPCAATASKKAGVVKRGWSSCTNPLCAPLLPTLSTAQLRSLHQ